MQIKTIYECPRCEEIIPGETKPEHCPECGADLMDTEEELRGYSYPVTMTEQHIKFKEDALFYDALIMMPITKANDIMNDALFLMETIAAKNVPVSG
jgi:hypothetical protein